MKYPPRVHVLKPPWSTACGVISMWWYLQEVEPSAKKLGQQKGPLEEIRSLALLSLSLVPSQGELLVLLCYILPVMMLCLASCPTTTETTTTTEDRNWAKIIFFVL